MNSPTILERFLRSPAGRKLAQEEEGETLARRKALAAEIKRLEEEYAKAEPDLAEAVTAAEARYKAVEAEFKAAALALGEARTAHLYASSRHEHEVNRLKADLAALAPAAVGEFIEELPGLADKARGALQTSAWGERDWLTSKATQHVASNRAGILAHIAALRAARQEAEALQYVAVSDEEIVTRLEKLRAGLPEVGEMVEVVA